MQTVVSIPVVYSALMNRIPEDQRSDLRSVIVAILNLVHGLYEIDEDADGEDDRLIGALVSHHMLIVEQG